MTWVVMRAKNDVPFVEKTLLALRQQSRPARVLVFDDGSTDGTLDVARNLADRVLPVPGGRYVPGKVLNEGMRQTDGEVVAFLNSDCIPRDHLWLEELLAAFDSGEVAAAFGCQLPREDCWPPYAKDLEETFGNGSRQRRWRNCFSMASSAVRRSIWKQMPFNESLAYSEDIEWTWRARQAGYQVRYAPHSVVEHSHNYSFGALYRRHYGEGRAEAQIFRWTWRERNLLRYSVLPFGRQVAGDWMHCLTRGRPAFLLWSPLLRLAQGMGRRAGFREGARACKT